MAEIDLRLDDIKYPLPPEILEKLGDSFRRINLYTDNTRALIEKLADHYDVNIGQIILLNSVEEGVELLSKLYGNYVVYFTPTTAAFSRAFQGRRGRFKKINCLMDGRYLIDPNLPELEYSQLVFIKNPNIPFGQVSLGQIKTIADRIKGIVAVDESYARFGSKSSIELIGNVKNVAVMRSFTQEFGAGGLALAFLAVSEEIAHELRPYKNPFNISAVSVRIALELINSDYYFDSLTAQLQKIKKSLIRVLNSKGWTVMKSENNLVTVKFATPAEAENLVRYLAQNGFLVNQGNGIQVMGLDKSFVWFSMGTSEQMQQLGQIMQNY